MKKKAIRIIVKSVVCIVAFVLVAVLTLPLWFGPVVTTAANALVPGIVKTDFRLDHLSLNPYTARFELGGLMLANPKGYFEKYAATVGDITVDAKVFSLPTDVIHIEEIKIKDIFVSYVSGGPEKINNFTQIQYNVAGGREACEAGQAQKAEAPAAQAKKDSPKSEKRFIIDRLEISGLMVQFGFLPIRQPLPLVMTDIGLKTGGATYSEILQQVWSEILRQAGVVGDQLKAFGGAASDAASRATESVKALGAGLKVEENVKSVGDGAKKALDSLKGLW